MKALLATAALALPAFIGLSGCASSDTSAPGAAGASAAPAQREYRTGSRFPVKDDTSTLTPEERQRQIDDARAAAQRAPAGPGVPMPR